MKQSLKEKSSKPLDITSLSNKKPSQANTKMSKQHSLQSSKHQSSNAIEKDAQSNHSAAKLERDTEQDLEKQIKVYEEKIRLEKEQRAALIEYKKQEIAKIKASIDKTNKGNQRLQSELEILQVEVQEKLDKIEFKDKRIQFERTKKQAEGPLEQLVKVKEKVLKNTMHVIGNYQKEREKYEELIKEKIDLDQINSLNDKIKLSNEKVAELESEVAFYQKIKEEHMNCTKKKEKLELDITEIKKSILALKRENKEKIRSERATRAYMPNMDEIAKSKKSPEEKEREMKKNLNEFWLKNEHVFQLNSLEEQSMTVDKVIGYDRNPKRNKADLPKIQLFNSEERKVLSNILPPREIEKFERRYESIDITKVNLEKKFALESKLMNKENQNLERRYEYSTQQLKEHEDKNKAIMEQINTRRDELQSLKVKLGDLMKNLEDSKAKMKEKEDENKALTSELQAIRNRINSNDPNHLDKSNQVSA